MSNIFTYGFSLQGKSHKKTGICCQDSHRIENPGKICIAAVADGVGSAANSQIGSNIAVNTAVDFCCSHYARYESDLKSLITKAYENALDRIFEEAEQKGNPVESYDTTLSLAIYDGRKTAFGHSGDGAIIGLADSGDFVEITRPQKGSDRISVIPLRAGSQFWQIDSCSQDFAALLLLTDGMLNTLSPYLLKLDKKSCGIYVPLASYFADLQCIVKTDGDNIKNKIEKFVTAENNYNSEDFYNYLSAIYRQHLPERQAEELISIIRANNFPVRLMQNEQDDKTVAALINTGIRVGNKSAGFYAEPNWMELSDMWRRQAYPHLYKNNPPQKEEISKEDKSGKITENMPGRTVGSAEDRIDLHRKRKKSGLKRKRRMKNRLKRR